jgi:pimeloyl-ACP methyl ester carboxylesterase
VAALACRRVGTGPPVVLLHGGLIHGDLTWALQMPLAKRWTLIVPDRIGYGESAHLGEAEDFGRDAELLAPALDDGSHLVGYSSGATAAMLTAARRPEAVASLTLIEPPAFHLAPESVSAREMLAGHERLFDQPLDDPVAFLKAFYALIGTDAPPDAALEALAAPTRVWHGLRRPWVGDLALDQLAVAPFPKLVISGGHSQAFEDVCDAIAAAIGAERDVIQGAGHSVQGTGQPFNERLESFLAG